MNALSISSRVEDRSAFSFLETMVALGLLAVLVAFLIPALSRRSQEAQTAGCAARLRQLGVAVQLWRQDRNDRFAPDLTEVSKRPSQYLYEADLLPSPQVMACPSADTLARSAWYDVTSSYGTAYQKAFLNQPVSYGVNAFAFYQAYPSGWGGGITMTTTFRMYAGKEGAVPLVMDAHGFQVNHPMWRDPVRARFAYRHGGRCHVLFLDGHLEALDASGVGALHPLGNRGKIY